MCVLIRAWGRQSSPKNLYNSANSEWFCRLHKTFFPKIRKPFMPEPFFVCLPKALPQVEIGCGFHTLWDIPFTTKVIYARFKFHSSRICSISFGFHSTLREIVSNFQESGDRSKTSTFFFCSKPFWWTVLFWPKYESSKSAKTYLICIFLSCLQCIFTTLVQDNKKLSWIHFFISCFSSLGIAFQLYFISN